MTSETLGPHCWTVEPTSIFETLGLVCHASLIPSTIIMHAFGYISSTLAWYVHDSRVYLFSSCTLLHYIIRSLMRYVFMHVYRQCHVTQTWLMRKYYTYSWFTYVHVRRQTTPNDYGYVLAMFTFCICLCSHYVTPWHSMYTLFLESAPLGFDSSKVEPGWVWV